MNFLIILDPLEKLDPEWDNSLALGAELLRRGRAVWTADVPDLWTENGEVFARASRLISFPSRPFASRFRIGTSKTWKLSAFDLVLVRKEPPVNDRYLSMTQLLELAAAKVPVQNHPRGLRSINEKLWTLQFPRWVPPTLVSCSEKEILAFHKKQGKIVIKPLDQKGGKGVFIFEPSLRPKLRKAVKNGEKFVIAQKFLPIQEGGEKRIVVLNGELLAAYEKRPRGNEFRANLGLGGTFHAAEPDAAEKQLVRELKPYLLKEGISFAGLDVLNGKLIEVNVTSPAGITEAQFLYPRLKPVSAWADFLERSASLKNSR